MRDRQAGGPPFKSPNSRCPILPWFWEGWEPETLAPVVSITPQSGRDKQFSAGSIVSHPCKVRKDGAPFLVAVSRKTKGGAPGHEAWACLLLASRDFSDPQLGFLKSVHSNGFSFRLQTAVELGSTGLFDSAKARFARMPIRLLPFSQSLRGGSVPTWPGLATSLRASGGYVATRIALRASQFRRFVRFGPEAQEIR